MKDKLKLALLFGGRSAEHEISVLSAANIARALDPDRYEVSAVAVGRDGTMRLNRSILDTLPPGSMELRQVGADGPQVLLAGPPPRLIGLDGSETPFDVAFPILHGPYGEDGTLQGYLRFVGAAFVGPDVLSSAAAMDKIFAKRLLAQAGIRVARWRDYSSAAAAEADLEKLVSDYALPLFVKPANMGSSVGVSRVDKPGEFAAAVAEAFRYDRHILVEEGIQGRELECAVLGNDQPEVSLPGEVLPRGSFYSYAAKYVDAEGAGIAIPAALATTVIERVRGVAAAAYVALRCEGLSRVDMFLTPDGAVFVNEVNTLPGFTKVSMYPALWEAGGLGYSALLDRLVALALERHRRQASLAFSPE